MVRRPGTALAVLRPAALLSSAALIDPAAVVDISVAITCKDSNAGRLVAARRLNVWHRPMAEIATRPAGSTLQT